MKTLKVNPIPEDIYREIGCTWYKTPGDAPSIADELVLITEAEGDSYYKAAEELYDMFIHAADHVIENRLYRLLDIDEALIPMIEHTWNSDRHFHLMGRFDFAGGIDGLPIKLIEFNADTPSLIYETAVIQWMQLRHNKLDETRQFNALYETLKESFIRLRGLNPCFAASPREIPRALFCSLSQFPEDENTARLIEEAAYEAGFITDFEFIDNVFFSSGEGIFLKDAERYYRYDYWFKNLPYEFISLYEPELAAILTDVLINERAVVLNPPYALLFQSKGLLKILWDMYGGHPLLLESAFEPMAGKAYVEKKTLGREGQNVSIVDKTGRTVMSNDGEYGAFKSVYQEYARFPEDEQGRLYQAGVFFSYEPCGLGFRRERGIIHNNSQFVGHFVEG
ncbi:MAG: glutathionylspermidine synthase family protein [Candidatus Magnetominusculus sp. LBB02]|nr:glutathionylspermidine synthase family protein [Candidatus Magnetominusculus sp. LBB02]